MPKQLNVDLTFNANTDAAKRQIMELQRALQDVTKLPSKSSALFDDRQLKSASKAAMELQKHLLAAVNVNTGQLDLSRLSTSLAAANKDLKTYVNTLMQAGPTGQNAFMQLAKAVSTAEAPVTRINARLAEMGTTLKNTVRWQLSSSILHGFMGSVKAAYGYAQDLNQSLNNIRIVTGASVEEMSAFANNANKAAQALSTTTTSYTDAALIYYQQGIRDQKEIAGRTETTIKLANVSRQSAEEVSQEMTAIWNNFYDGSKSLEFYADAITALGASTASSSQEIATGLEKFAAISKTVGLSYEYATAALATITAQTRQSADTVGTGLRTLFSRLEGLKLGETLEDGVDLNKYSQALDAVGVQVLDLNGEIRDMDSILDDLGNRWKELSQAQQIALAQTVGGVRQYTNLIALMDNWDKMQQNVATARGSEGTLQQQADIYAESWEAAQKRVKAAAESIYADLFNDQFFITLTNGLAKVIEGIGGIVKSFGGLQGVLLAVSSIFLNKYAYEMPAILENFKQNLMVVTGKAKEETAKIQSQMMNTLQDIQQNPNASASTKIQAEGYAQVTKMQQQLLNNSRVMSEAQQAEYKLQMQLVQAGYDEVQVLQEKVDAKRAEISAIKDSIAAKAEEEAKNLLSEQADLENAKVAWEDKRAAVQTDTSLSDEEKAARLENIANKIDEIEVRLGVIRPKIAALGDEFKELGDNITNSGTAADKLMALKDVSDTVKESIQKVADSYEDQATKFAKIENVNASIGSQVDQWKMLTSALKEDSTQIDNVKDKMLQYVDIVKNTAKDVGYKEDSQMMATLDGLKAKLQEAKTAGDLQPILDEFAQVSMSAQDVNINLDQLEQQLKDLGVSPEKISEFRRNVQGLTEDIVNTNNALENTRGLAQAPEKQLTKTSTVMTKYAASVMTVFNAMKTVKNALSTIFDDEASAMDRIGAAVGALMSISMAYNSVQSMAVALTNSEMMAHLGSASAKFLSAEAQTALNAAIAANPVGAVLVAVLALIAALAVLIISIDAIRDHINADKIAAQEAAKAAEEMGKRADEAQQAADGLRSTIEGYDSCAKKLAECTKGTQEWRDALRETNKAAIETLNNASQFLDETDYAKLAQSYRENHELDPEILQKAQAGADNQALMASYAKSLADYMATQAQITADITKFRRDLESQSISDTNYDNAQFSQVVRDNLEDLGSALDAKEFKQKLAALGVDVSHFSEDTLETWRKDVSTMADTAVEAALKLGLIADMQVDQLLEDLGLGDKYNDAEKKYASGQLQNSAFTAVQYENTAELMRNAYGTVDPMLVSGAEDIVTALKETYGTQDVEFKKSGGMFGKDKNKSIWSIGGEDVPLSDKEIGELTAAYQGTKGIVDNVGKAKDFLDKASGEMVDFSQALMEDFDAANKEINTDKYVGSLTAKEMDSVKGLEGDALLKALHLNPDDVTELASLFDTDKEAVIDSLKESITEGEENFAELGKSLYGPLQTIFNEVIKTAGDVTLDEAKNIEGSMKKLFTDSGGDMDAMKAYGSALSKLGEDAPEFIEAIDSIDWKNADVSDLDEILKDLGHDADFAASDIRILLDALRNFSSLNTQTPEERYKSINDITSGLSDGGTITEAQRDVLKEGGVDVDYFFNKAADGTYLLKTSAEELQNSILNTGVALSGFTEKINSLRNQLGMMQEWQDQGLSYDSFSGTQTEGSEGFNRQLQAVNTFSEESGIEPEALAQIRAAAEDPSIQVSPENLQLLADAYGNLKNIIGDNVIADSMKDIAESEKELSEQSQTSRIAQDVDMEQVQKYSKYLRDEAKNLDWVNDSLADNEEALLDTAAAWEDAIEGIEKIQKEWKNWNKLGLKTPEVLSEVSGVLSDIFNTDISNDFVADHLEEIERLAEGDVSAINDIGLALAENSLKDLEVDIDKEVWDQEVEDIINDINEIGLENIEVGARIEDAPFYDALNAMILDSCTTQEQVNDILGKIGYNPKVTMKEVRIDQIQQSDTDGTYTMTYSGLEGEGGTVTVSEHFANSHKNGDTVTIPVIEGSTFAGRAAGAGHSGRTGGGNGGGGSCFVSGTLITTNEGFKNIEFIQAGDIVLSYNEQLQVNEYSEVVQTMIHKTQENIYTLYIADETIRATGIHRFFILRNDKPEWIHAENLMVGDSVLFANYTWNKIDKIDIKLEEQIVYNFEVANNHNYYVGKNQILAHNKGSGGGGGRRKEKAQGRTRSDAERYHVVRSQLGILGKEYDKISAAFDRAFGKEKLGLLDQQIKKQTQLVKKQQDYVKEIEKYLKIDKANLSQKGKGKYKYWSETDEKMKTVNVNSKDYLNMSIDFDKGGSILNYEKLVKKAEAKLDAARKKWNASAQKEADKRSWEKAQAQYEGFMEMMKQYEETNNLLLDETNNLLQKQNELFDKKLERTELRLKLRIDVADDSLDFLSNLLEQVGDNAYKAATRIALIGQQLAADRLKIKAYDKDLKGLISNHGFSNKERDKIFSQLASGPVDAEKMAEKLAKKEGAFTDSELENLRSVVDGYIEANNNLMAYRKGVIEEIGKVMDENIKRLDRISEKMEYLQGLSNSYKNIIDLTGRSYLKISSEVYKNIDRENVQLAAMSLNMAKTRRTQAALQYEDLVKKYKAVYNTIEADERQYWEDQISQAAAYVEEMTTAYYESWEQALEAVNAQFESSMNLMMEDFNEIMAKNAGNLEGLQQKMALKKEVADTYVPMYEKMYQLNKLASEAQKSIDQSSNIKVSRELQQIQQKILDARASQNKMSQYEIDFLQRELELKQAQLALEEAQDAKSQVRMTRDSEGNYSYVYTADENKVQDAEDNYNAKLYEMQKLNDEYVNNIQEKLASLQANYISAMSEAASVYGYGTEAYYRAIADIQTSYNEHFNNLAGPDGELSKALENQAFVQDHYAGIYTKITGDVYQANVQLATSWEDTLLKVETGFNSLAEYQNAWSTASTQAYKSALIAMEEWKLGMDAVYKVAGSSTANFGTEVSNMMSNLTDWGTTTSTEMGNMAAVSQAAIETVSTAVVDWEEKFSKIIQDRIDQNNQLIANINNVIAAWSGLNSLDMNDALISTMSLDEIAAEKQRARTALDRAEDKKNRAVDAKKRARTALDRASRKRGVASLRKAANKVTKRKTAVTKAAKKRGVSKIIRNRRTMADARKTMRKVRKNSRAYKEARRRYDNARKSNRKLLRNRTIRRNWDSYRRARTNLTKARRTFDTKLRRASRTVRRNWKRYNTAVKNYADATSAARAANTRYTKAKNTYDYWQSKYEEMKTSMAANPVDANSVSLSAANLGNAADSNAQATISSLDGLTFAPSINVTIPSELTQHVDITASFPGITTGEEVVKTFTQDLTSLAMQHAYAT